MPASSVRYFTDSDDFATSIRATKAELTVSGRGEFAAKVVRVDLHRLWLQRLDDNLPRIAHLANLKGRAIVTFRTAAGPELIRNGRSVEMHHLQRCSDGQEGYERSAGNSSRAAMSLPIEDIAQIGTKMVGIDLSPLRYEQSVTPAAPAMANLQRLHAAAGQLAERAPEVIANPEAARGLEQDLILALVACLASKEGRADVAADGRQDIVMRRFRRMLEANPDRAIHLPELCSAIGVSDRTLRNYCHQQLGMGPARYLWLRRMHLARRALNLAEGSTTTVTGVATAHGFWELGRFAVEYRTLFGERPSATLQRPPAIH